MNGAWRTTSVLAFCCLIVGLPSTWAFWIENGVPLCTSMENQSYPKITSDDAGGAIITWQDYRSGSNDDIYVQRVGATGAVQWTVDGVALCTASGDQELPVIVSDGAGGAIIAWHDRRTGTGDIYAQRVNAAGAVQWGSNGTVISAAVGNQRYPEIISDGAGGAIIVWEDERNGNKDIYAQRVNGAGTALWTTDGVPVCTVTGNQYSLTITTDGLGGVIVSWVDYRTECDIYAQRVNASGSAQWNGTSGAAICTATGLQEYPSIASDGAGGAMIAWQDKRGGSNYDIYLQHVNIAGTAQWSTDGWAICSEAGDQTYPKAISDGAGGVIVAWQDARNGNNDIFAQSINVGERWGSGGLMICMESAGQYIPKLASDDEGGAIITWRDYRNGSADIYAQHVGEWGNFLWTMNGVALCTSWGQQMDPRITRDGAGGALVTWYEDRGGNNDVYAQVIDRYGRIGYNAPEIFSIRDVPGDQGGAVYLSWRAARPDVFMDDDMSYYSIWRAIAPASALTALADGAVSVGDLSRLDASSDKPLIRIELVDGLTYFWELVETVDVFYMEAYGKPVATLFDSTAACTEYHYFQVVAHTTDPKVFWTSEPDSGYSVDNIAPCPPICLIGEQSFAPVGLNLTWQSNTEADLDDYRVYRGLSEDFTPGPGNLIASPCDTTHFDGEWRWSDGYYYKVSAVDVHGNESGFALLNPDEVTGTETSNAPVANYVAQNYPNPFNPSTSIPFGISESGHISLRIYDSAGRLVRILRDGRCEAGIYQEVWDGRSAGGVPVASGVYFYRLVAGDFVKTKKMVLLK